MKSPKATTRRIAHAEAFNAGARAIARKCGAVEVEDPIFGEDTALSIVTRFGPMTIHPGTEPHSVLDGIHKGCFFTVFCRFRDSRYFREAYDVFGANPHSGKHNFHHDCGNSDDDLAQALAAFNDHLRRTLP